MTFFAGLPFTGLGTPITLDGDDQYFLADGVTVYSTSDAAVKSTGFNNTFRIEGTLIGTVGLRADQFSSDFGQRVAISPTGKVIGSAGDAISIYGMQTTVVNQGLIAGVWGVYYYAGSGAGSVVSNSGRIMSDKSAIVTNGEKLSLANSGSITSYGEYAYYGDDGAETIVNKGVMTGNLAFDGGIVIRLEAGADRYDGTGGRANGIVAGDLGNDVLIGGSLVDKFDGGPNADSLYGRGGNDNLRGGLGADKFYFDTAPSTTANRDFIPDYNAVEDQIYLRKTVFAAIVQAAGTLQQQYYWESATGLAHDATDRVILNTLNGVLSYDTNGSAAGGVQQIAVLAMVGATLSNADFVLY